MSRVPSLSSPFLLGFDEIERALDRVVKGADGYPPYNIERTGEDAYRITMAVAGFGEDEIAIESNRNVLSVKAEKATEDKAEEREFLYRGIAARSFERRFQLADHVHVTGAELKNGLLHIDLKREIPEELKPRKIAIATAKPAKVSKQIEAKAA